MDYTITTNKTGEVAQVNGSLFVMKNSNAFLYSLTICVIIILVILWLYNSDKIKYVSEEIDKKVRFDIPDKKDAKGAKEPKEPKKSSEKNNDIEAEIDKVNAM
jgi:hypothetical protein